MSPKTLLIAAAALCASAAVTLPATAAPDGTNPPARPLPFRAQILFNLVDTNGDGSIDPTELAAFQKAVFNAIDADHDGKLSPAEFARIADSFGGGMGPGGQGRPLARFMMQHHHWGPGGPGRPGMGGPGQDGGAGPLRQGMLDDQQGPGGPQLGQNQDGQQPQTFASLDKNGDGVISPDEFSAAMPGMLPAPPAPPAPQQ